MRARPLRPLVVAALLTALFLWPATPARADVTVSIGAGGVSPSQLTIAVGESVTFQNNDSQRWLMTDMGGGLVTLMQMNTGRYLDAHEIPELDYRVVTRPRQEFDYTQLWRLTDYGGGFVTIQHYNTGLFLEPVLDPGYDYQVVLRPERPGDNLQTWRM